MPTTILSTLVRCSGNSGNSELHQSCRLAGNKHCSPFLYRSRHLGLDGFFDLLDTQLLARRFPVRVLIAVVFDILRCRLKIACRSIKCFLSSISHDKPLGDQNTDDSCNIKAKRGRETFAECRGVQLREGHDG